MIKILLQEGFALKDRGHYKHAIEVFYKALEEDNTSTELLFEIADLYYRMQNEERALNYIDKFWTEFRNISPLLNFWKKYLLIETR